MPEPNSYNTNSVFSSGGSAYNILNNTTSQLVNNGIGAYIGNNTYFGGSLNQSTVTTSGNPMVKAQSVVERYLGNPSYNTRVVNGTTVYGQTPTSSDYQGTTWNDLSASQQQEMIQAAQNGNNNGTTEYNDSGGTPGSAPAWLGIASQVAGGAADLASSFSSHKDPGDSNYAIKQNVGDALLKSGNLYAMAAGAAVKGITFAQRAAGKETSNINNAQAKAADIGKGTQVMNTALDFLTLGTGLDFLLPKHVSNMNQSQEVDNLRGAYAGTTSNIDTAGTMAGKNYFLGANKLNDYVDQQNRNVQLLTQIGIDNTQRISSVPYNADLINTRNFNKLNGTTYQGYGTRIGKQGMKMLSREELDRIYTSKKTNESDIQKFENGGSIMIPDGKLHAHKHHMEDVNPDLAEDLTKKGIPVVVTDENGEVTQVAEIEKEEIILEKSLTERIEDLRKDGSEEAMIKAGKLIVDALFNDSTDNAGLINNVE